MKKFFTSTVYQLVGIEQKDGLDLNWSLSARLVLNRMPSAILLLTLTTQS